MLIKIIVIIILIIIIISIQEGSDKLCESVLLLFVKHATKVLHYVLPPSWLLNLSLKRWLLLSRRLLGRCK